MIAPTLIRLASTSASALVASVAEAAVLVTLTALCMHLVRLTPAVRSRVWTAAFLLTLLLPVASVLHRPASVPALAAPQGFHIDIVWAVVLACVWAVLSLVRVAQLIQSAVRLRSTARHSSAIDSAAFAPLLELHAGTIFHRFVQLCTSDRVDVPSVAGFLHPRILLPPTVLSHLSPADLRQIVLHEMEHLRRFDDWTNLLQKLGLAFFPLNPVLFWLERRLCEEREMACDDGVLRSTGSGKAYATCLANLAEQTILRRSLSLALGAWQRQSELGRRVQRILQSPQRSSSRFAATAILTGVLTAGVALTLAPQLVTFSPSAPVVVAAAEVPLSSVLPSLAATSSAGAHATLVSAVMPGPPSSARLARPHVARARRAVVIQRRQAQLEAGPWLILTNWDSAGTPPRIRFAISQDSQSAYAALPVRDGWLIVQL